MRNIVLIGMPGSGKSTIGVLLAKTLGLDFLDVDLLIQRREGRLLQDILDRDGICRFLELEEAAVCSVEGTGMVIAPGGSAVCMEAGARHLKELGTLVYLQLGPETLRKRLYNIKTRGIAMQPGESIEDVYRARAPLYERYADLTVEAEGKSAEDIVEEIRECLEKKNGNCPNIGCQTEAFPVK